MTDFSGKVVFITGAASGIGAATARLAAAQGAQVILADRDAPRGTDLAGQIGSNASFMQLDVSSEASWQSAIGDVRKRFGRIDVLVNAAGVNPSTNIVDTSYDEWRGAFAVNADGVFFGCKYAVRTMIETAVAGAIVNVSSPIGVKPWATLIAYGASKAAVLNLTKSVALYCAEQKTGIRCNAVLPGAVHTAMMDRYLETVPDADAALAALADGQPTGRLVEAGEVAQAILYLAGDGSLAVTGVVLPVDGGSLLR